MDVLLASTENALAAALLVRTPDFWRAYVEPVQDFLQGQRRSIRCSTSFALAKNPDDPQSTS
jgi:hypothetical protein